MTCVESLKKQIIGSRTAKDKQDGLSESTGRAAREMVSRCVDAGAPLSRQPTDILMGAAPCFRDLAIGIFDPRNQVQLQESMASGDAQRVISFFTQGPAQAFS